MLRKLWIVLAFLLVPAVASADAHRAGGFGGGGFLKGSRLDGFQIGTDIAPFTNPYVSLLGEFGKYSGDHEGSDVTAKLFMGGAAWKFAANDSSPFVGSFHGQVGALTVKDKATNLSSTDFLFAVGGAAEVILKRTEPKQYGVRVQLDKVFAKDGDDFVRFSVNGLVRFKF